MYLEPVKAEDALALPQLPFCVYGAEGFFHLPQQAGRDIQLVVARVQIFYRQFCHFLDGAEKLPGVCGGIKGVQAAAVSQVAGIEGTPGRFIEAAVPGGMAGGVEYGDFPPAQADHIPILQGPPASPPGKSGSRQGQTLAGKRRALG